jgi:hypothetical protein
MKINENSYNIFEIKRYSKSMIEKLRQFNQYFGHDGKNNSN